VAAAENTGDSRFLLLKWGVVGKPGLTARQICAPLPADKGVGLTEKAILKGRRMLAAKLVVVGGDAQQAEIELRLPLLVGRGRDVELTVPHALVSRRHCEIIERDGRLVVRDLGSLNGTFVNNQRIENEQILEPDQLLTLGTVTFRAVYQVDSEVADDLVATADTEAIGSSQTESGLQVAENQLLEAVGATIAVGAVARSPLAAEASKHSEMGESSGLLDESPQGNSGSGSQKMTVSLDSFKAAADAETLPQESQLQEEVADEDAADESMLGSFLGNLPQ
jgi:pSer/pThr/pTyr-binding forkhead associated (FHA) protein